jgi:hypothetical protein
MWVCLNSRPKWVWVVGDHWLGVRVRSRVILATVIFIVLLHSVMGMLKFLDNNLNDWLVYIDSPYHRMSVVE